jgi:hypothetical protein
MSNSAQKRPDSHGPPNGDNVGRRTDGRPFPLFSAYYCRRESGRDPKSNFAHNDKHQTTSDKWSWCPDDNGDGKQATPAPGALLRLQQSFSVHSSGGVSLQAGGALLHKLQVLQRSGFSTWLQKPTPAAH